MYRQIIKFKALFPCSNRADYVRGIGPTTYATDVR